MAEASISLDRNQLSCPVCLDLLKDPVTIPCGYSFCMVCVNGHWNKEDQKKVYSCPQCRETFTPRPVLRKKKNILGEVVEKLKRTELQASSSSHCFAGPGDVECDSCTGRKRKAREFCLVCLASFRKSHVKPHYQSPVFKKHKLVEASTQMQEMICSHHDKLMEIYCRTDQSCICYLCTMDEHKGHETVSAASERTQKQSQMKEVEMEFQVRLQKKEKKLEELKQAIRTFKCSTEAALKDSDKISAELICSIKKKILEVTDLIRRQESTQLSQGEELQKKLELEVADLKRKHTKLEQLSHTEDHISFLLTFQSFCESFGSTDSSNVTVNEHLSLDGVKKSLQNLKECLEKLCTEETNKILSKHAVRVQLILPSEPKSREDFLHYFKQLSLDPDTVNCSLVLSEDNSLVRWSKRNLRYPDHPERFDGRAQVLCKESICGRCYWEVEWTGKEDWFVSIAVSYKGIKRKGQDKECVFGHNEQSWSLKCFSTLSFWHNDIKTEIPAPSSSRVGVYVDHDAGTVSFYSVSDTMTLLHTVHTTFTRPLYAGIGVEGGRVKLCVLKRRILPWSSFI